MSRRRKPLPEAYRLAFPPPAPGDVLPVTCTGGGAHPGNVLAEVTLAADGQTVLWRHRLHGKDPVTPWRGSPAGNTFRFRCRRPECRNAAGRPRDARIVPPKMAEAIRGLRAIGVRVLDISRMPLP